MVSTINERVAAAFLFLLILVVLVLYAIGLYQYELVGSYEASVTMNPYCVRKYCSEDGTQKDSYQIPPNDDLQRASYQTPNYCIVNAPPCEIQSAMAVCANPSVPGSDLTNSVSTDDLKQILEFYNQHYYTRCSYRYGGPSGPHVTVSTNAPTDNTVNSVSEQFGPNDQFLVNLLACAKTQGLDSDPNWIALNTVCGQACQGQSTT